MDISLMWLLAGLLAGLILFACVVLILVAAWLVTTRWVTPPWLTAPGRRTRLPPPGRGSRRQRSASDVVVATIATESDSAHSRKTGIPLRNAYVSHLCGTEDGRAGDARMVTVREFRSAVAGRGPGSPSFVGWGAGVGLRCQPRATAHSHNAPSRANRVL
jgi:hypothetical protein